MKHVWALGNILGWYVMESDIINPAMLGRIYTYLQVLLLGNTQLLKIYG